MIADSLDTAESNAEMVLHAETRIHTEQSRLILQNYIWLYLIWLHGTILLIEDDWYFILNVNQQTVVEYTVSFAFCFDGKMIGLAKITLVKSGRFYKRP